MTNNYAVLLSGTNTLSVFDTDCNPGFYDGKDGIVIVAPASFVDVLLRLCQREDYDFARQSQRTKNQKEKAVLTWSNSRRY
jgi:hypothetical protein